MKIGNIIERAERLPVGVIATAVGAATLSNAYVVFGLTFLRHIFMWIAFIVLILSILKLTIHNKTFRAEYQNTVPASLYGTFSMLLMIVGSYLLPYSQIIGKGLWLIGVSFHTILILIFTYRNVIKNFVKDTFVPSWFVTYNGVMVAVVVSGGMNEPLITKIITYYGLGIFFLIVPFMVYRLATHPVKELIQHTKAVIIAPSSLCLVSVLTVIPNASPYLIGILYLIILLSLLFFAINIPDFFSVPFHPGFAGMTFPMAIGTVASLRLAAYLGNNNLLELQNIVKNIAGIQLYVTTVIIGVVFYNFLKKVFKD